MQHWYVVHTKPRQEQLACDNLCRQGFNTYLPRLKVIKRVQGQHRAVFDPLFPRYIFLQPSSASQSISPVRSSIGVSTVVRFGQEPAAISNELVLGLRRFEAYQNATKNEEISPFKEGKMVRVVEGALKGMEGLILKTSKQRVTLLMQLLGQEREVNLDSHQLLFV
jgi:transcriptional antiterminator RfaH